MIRIRAHSIVFRLVAVASAAWLIGGCAGLRTGVTHGSRRVARTPVPPAHVELPDEREQAVLAVVEEFLERTRDYQLARPASTGTLPPAVPTPLGSPEHLDDGPGNNANPAVLAATRGTEAADEAVANTQVTLGEIAYSRPSLALPVVQNVSIRPRGKPETPPDQPATASATNEALDVRREQPVVSADRILQELESRAEQAGDFDSEWQVRLVQLAFNRVPKVIERSPHLNPDAARILDTLLNVVAAARRAARNPLLIGEDALDRVEELRQVLADRADPRVSAIVLCRKVVTYGVYEEMPSDAFVAGRTTPTIVYSEIRNLRAEPTDDGHFRTLLASRLEILTAEGTSLWQQEEPEIVDQCRRRRTDFFIAQRIALPATLAAGEYVLKVLVEDKLSGKADEAAYRFSVDSATSVATARSQHIGQ